jgi:HD superfamily phosphodiesterase
MKLYSTLINYAFNYVINTSKLYNIDESHSLRHSIEVFEFANKLYNQEIITNPELLQQKNIIMCSAILHDMCDKKYMTEQEGIKKINSYFKDFLLDEEILIINNIISSMSYSTVKQNGFPDLNMYNRAYHIVREADLLAAYDVNRCIIYQMFHDKTDYVKSLEYVKKLFKNRVLKYIDDDLFTTEYSNNLAKNLHEMALIKLQEIDSLHYELN